MSYPSPYAGSMNVSAPAPTPQPNEVWLKDELIPFLRHAFSWANNVMADYDFNPHIANAIRDWQRPVDDPRLLGRTIPDQDYNFHGVFLAITNRHLDKYQPHATFIDDIDAVTRYLVRRYYMKGEYKLQGLSNVASEEYVREYEARMQIVQAAAGAQDQEPEYEYSDPTSAFGRPAQPYYRKLTIEERQAHARQAAQEAYERIVSASTSASAIAGRSSYHTDPSLR
ncbi:hypothetical protein BDV96DRAFT_348668 [Lophiotrema nucula]|uniref:Uncharacterized protein n=1 Tax=Lophiotrema nucula TaxID=690887 RepID=A0A6A5ZJ38_9PLEO|nr:hypothetical protein BDV96DRAFT_348668 [Lophiotrema nucula]